MSSRHSSRPSDWRGFQTSTVILFVSVLTSSKTNGVCRTRKLECQKWKRNRGFEISHDRCGWHRRNKNSSRHGDGARASIGSEVVPHRNCSLRQRLVHATRRTARHG